MSDKTGDISTALAPIANCTLTPSRRSAEALDEPTVELDQKALHVRGNVHDSDQ